MYRPADDHELETRELLGQGGTALVTRAYHSGLKCELAVKHPADESIIAPPDFARLIQRERDLIGGYRFPGIVRLLPDTRQKPDRLLLELCQGPTLDSVARIDAPRVALNLISALAADLEFLRMAGIIHGDIKPHNFFLPPKWSEICEEQLFFVKLSDFSLGRSLEEPETARLGLGTVGYMAPEILTSAETSHLSDLFALGVIAYRLLTGHHPFMEDDCEPVKVNGRIQEQEPIPISKFRSDLEPALITIVDSLLNKQAEDRPASGWEVCELLEQAGATYSYRKLLRPGYLVRRADPYAANKNRTLGADDTVPTRLDRLTQGQPDHLRIVLNHNFFLGNLAYGGNLFRFHETPYCPSRLRRQILKRFTELPMSVKKTEIRNAVTSQSQRPASRNPLYELLLPLLRPATVKRIAAEWAGPAEETEKFELASELYLKTGNLPAAERCADLAAHAMINESRYDRAITVLRRVDLAAQTNRREFDIRRALMLRGNAHKDCGELDRAAEMYRRIIALYSNREHDNTLAETYKYLGDLHRLRQDSTAALEALRESLSVFEELGDELEISHTLTNIGNVYWIGNDTRQALKQYRAAYKIQKRLGARTDIASTLHNIGTIFLLDGRVKRGIFLLNHTLALKKEIGHAGEIARTLNNLGYAYQVSGKPSEASDFISESLKINRRIGSHKEILYNLENLVALKISAGQLGASATLIDEGLELSDRYNHPAHQGVFFLYRATISKRLGQYDQADSALSRVDEIVEKYDEYGLNLRSRLQRASLRMHVGDRDRALEIARNVYDEAVEKRSSQAELESLILLARLTDAPDLFEIAARQIKDQRLVREMRLLKFGRAEYLARHGKCRLGLDVLVECLREPEAVIEDMEFPWMCTVAAQIYLETGDLANARGQIQRATQHAENLGLVPELIRAKLLQGNLSQEAQEYEVAYASFRGALNLARDIMNTITDPDDRVIYQRTPEITALTAGIKSLGKYLGQKQGAGR